MRHVTVLSVVAMLALAGTALADQHGMQGMSMTPRGDTGSASKAFNDAMMKMHEAMDITYSGNPDIDFAKGMEPHHAGAVDMAKVELKYGKDPILRQLAENIIASQEKEIALMRKWINEHGK